MLRNTIREDLCKDPLILSNPLTGKIDNNIIFELILDLIKNSSYNLISSGFEDYSSFCKETSLVVGSSFHWSLSPFLIFNTSAMIEGTTVVIDPPTSPAVVFRFIIISPPIYFNIYKSIKSLYITLFIRLISILNTKLYILEIISNLYRQLSSCLKSSGIKLPGKMTARIAGKK